MHERLNLSQSVSGKLFPRKVGENNFLNMWQYVKQFHILSSLDLDNMEQVELANINPMDETLTFQLQTRCAQ